MKPFNFVAPASVDETLRLLAEHGEGATLLAGGQSLLILLRQGLIAPDVVVGLKNVAELAGVTARDGGLRLGAMTTYRVASSDPLVASRYPVLARAAGSVGSVHIRNLGTVGGSVCHADPAGDVPTVLLALDATLHTLRPDGNAAAHPVDDFFRGLFETRLADDELLAWIDLPAEVATADDGTPAHSFGYRRFSFREGEYPMAVAAVRLGWEGDRCVNPRVAVGGGGLHPLRLAELERLLDGLPASEVARAAADAAPYGSLSPMADIRGSTEWKRRVVSSLVRDTVAEAVRARSQ